MAATELKTQAIANAAITQPKLAPGVGGNVDHSFRLQTSGTSVATATDVLMTWNEELFDTDNLHDIAVNNSRVTITSATAGKWLIKASIMFPNSPANAEGILRILKNSGVIDVGANAMPPPVFTNHTIKVSAIISLAAGDFVEINVRHNYGTTQTIGSSLPQGRSFFEGIRIA